MAAASDSIRTESSQEFELEKVTVKFYNAKNGFGFVRDAEGKDVFVSNTVVHAANLRFLKEKQELTIRRVRQMRRGKEEVVVGEIIKDKDNEG